MEEQFLIYNLWQIAINGEDFPEGTDCGGWRRGVEEQTGGFATCLEDCHFRYFNSTDIFFLILECIGLTRCSLAYDSLLRVSYFSNLSWCSFSFIILTFHYSLIRFLKVVDVLLY